MKREKKRNGHDTDGRKKESSSCGHSDAFTLQNEGIKRMKRNSGKRKREVNNSGLPPPVPQEHPTHTHTHTTAAAAEE